MRPLPLIRLILALVAVTSSVVAAHADPTPSPPTRPYTQTVPGTDVTFEMVPIPGGVFRMGSPLRDHSRALDDMPNIEVEVEPFYMGKHEVTWAEYEPFLRNYYRMAELPPEKRPEVPADRIADAVTYPTPLYKLEAGPVLDRMGRSGKFPAVAISQFDARQYTKWLSKKTGRFYRLPTEAEWEYACRAGTMTAYSFGNDRRKLDEYAWHIDNSALIDGDAAYREVGKKKPNPWGLYDMHGNVAEWCIDQYDPQYDPQWYRQFSALGRVKASDMINWPNKKHPRVIRGGSYEHESAECRSAARIGSTRHDVDSPNISDIPESPHWSSSGFWIGFRVVSPVKEPTEAEKLRFWNADDALTRKTIQRDREMHELVEPAAAAAEGR